MWNVNTDHTDEAGYGRTSGDCQICYGKPGKRKMERFEVQRTEFREESRWVGNCEWLIYRMEPREDENGGQGKFAVLKRLKKKKGFMAASILKSHA